MVFSSGHHAEQKILWVLTLYWLCLSWHQWQILWRLLDFEINTVMIFLQKFELLCSSMRGLPKQQPVIHAKGQYE